MSRNIETYKKMARLWNTYSKKKNRLLEKKQNSIPKYLPILFILLSPVLVIDVRFSIIPFAGLLGTASLIKVIRYNKSKEAFEEELAAGLAEIDPAEAEYFLMLVDSIKSFDHPDAKEVFQFIENVDSVTAAKDYWNVLTLDDFIMIYSNRDSAVHIEKRSEFKIMAGRTNKLTKTIKAEAVINNQTYSIHIDRKSYKGYLSSLEESFREGEE